MSEVVVAATQMTCNWDRAENIARAQELVRRAADDGANIVLIQELFETPYFCIEQDYRHQNLAQPLEGNPLIKTMSELAAELNVVLPVSFYERAGNTFFNSIAMLDADGSYLGLYRKSHIPNAVGYQEKDYFSPGDTGFRVWDTQFGKVGVGICWDQWFPEAARCMALMGAELLFYPTAIGSEPGSPDLDSMQHWRNTMCGHAAANIMPVVASNRIGTERSGDGSLEMTFYGSSFIADACGNVVASADKDTETVLTHRFDLDAIREHRQTWGVYRDRRPDLYGVLGTFDGKLGG